MLPGVLKAMNKNRPKMRELDPSTRQRIKEGDFLIRMISETQVAARKCEFYAGMAEDEEVKRTFEDEAKVLRNTAQTFQKYYESMTTE